MPTYEYECTKCGSVFELFQSITEKPKRRVGAGLKNCECDAPVRRLLGAGGGVIFRGGGFHETDYRSEEYKKAAKAETQPAVEPKPASSTEPTKTSDSPCGDAKDSQASPSSSSARRKSRKRAGGAV